MKTNPKLTCAIMAVLGAQAGAAYAADTASLGIEEIVVTAQRRTESIQNVPITIQAIGSESLRQLSITTFDDVIKMLPNVTFGTNGPGQGSIYMRGLSAGFAGGQSGASILPFPNVATYLDDQSLTFPGRNLDIYMVDMERVEVLEGPQGTLFGGGAEAGAVRYITAKPKLNVTEGRAEAGYGTTAHGDPNTSINAALNLPLIQDKLAVRGVIYSDRRGGYIDNVPSTFTRSPTLDQGPTTYTPYPANVAVANNYAIAQKAQNPVTYQGLRLSGLYQVNDDWSVLVQQSYQYMDAEGMSEQFPIGIDFQKLNPLEVNAFVPSWNRDHFSSTAWTVNGKFGDLRAVYTGSYQTRHIDANMDYSNYTRTGGGMYYSCADGPKGSGLHGSGDGSPLVCYSPVMGWHDTVESKHQSHEFRLSTPDEWRLRGLIGAFWEDFQIKDSMDFNQKTIPSCTPTNLAAALAGGPSCLANVTPVQAAINPNTRSDYTNFGEDLQRGYKQTAFFTSIDYDLIPKVLTVTGGTRYFRYVEQEVGSVYYDGTSCTNIPNGQCFANPINYSDHHATYSGFRSRGNLTWHPTVDTMVYYTYSQGFRPGAFNRTSAAETPVWINAAGQILPFGQAADTTAGDTRKKSYQYAKPLAYPPDTLTNNEIGFKSEFLNRRLILNGSFYQMDWKDVQTLIYNPPVYGNTTFGVKGPTYRVKGFELQTTWKMTDALTLMASLSHNNSTETNSPCIQSVGTTSGFSKNSRNPTPLGQCISAVRSGNYNVPLTNPLGAVGATPAFSPTLQYNIRLRWDGSVGDYKTYVMAGLNHVGDMNNTPSSFPSGDPPTTACPNNCAVPTTTWLRYLQPGYSTYDASIGVSKDAWDVTIFGQNLSNSNASTFTTSGQDIRAEVPLRPRVLGVKLGFKF